MCLGRRQLAQEERPQCKAVEESSYQRGDVGEEEGPARGDGCNHTVLSGRNGIRNSGESWGTGPEVKALAS